MATETQLSKPSNSVFRDRTGEAQNWARRAAETHKNTIFRSEFPSNRLPGSHTLCVVDEETACRGLTLQRLD